ncbi:MAG: cytochrome c3 family protein [Longimicrobiales bacterium]
MRLQWAAFGLAGAVLLVMAGIIAATQAPTSETESIQPIAFPHDLHAGKNQIPCQYCHTSADRSPDAGIPAVQVCAGCHIAGGQPLFRRDSAGIRLLAEYWNQQRPIPWVRIHDLPDHAHFPHMRHIKGGVTCQECHGPVETMREVVQQQPLWMGWCIECHRQREVRTDCAVCHY